MKKIATLLLITFLSIPSFALLGAGFHWGFDFTTTMDDVEGENIFKVSDFNSDSITLPPEFDSLSFMKVSRTNFDRTAIDFGGKIFVDVLPVEIEASINLGVWQYDGVISYLSGVDSSGGTAVPTYTDEALTIENLGGISYFGVDKTPYGKLNLDLTLKKTLKKIPIIKPSFGAGMSVHFATPVLSEQLIKDALDLGDDLSSINPDDLTDPAAIESILKQITDGAKKPKTGMHLLVGLKAKLPVIPLALYVDGKYIIMFNSIEDNVGVKTGGILLNTGILLNF